ncbi:hypothetical protein BC938DRAFT_479122 [Jimgerdemannia flammicorona]|uniref:Uncharacterized protein n=1 Tax=Jimgerdemannia flammicorona TaxID=994334 RepID=A0A433QY85_9FUNG|nr:hypothetical protein BC938DRAFT_479122 [Jimgerdemannia flammicorona]
MRLDGERIPVKRPVSELRRQDNTNNPQCENWLPWSIGQQVPIEGVVFRIHKMEKQLTDLQQPQGFSRIYNVT